MDAKIYEKLQKEFGTEDLRIFHYIKARMEDLIEEEERKKETDINALIKKAEEFNGRFLKFSNSSLSEYYKITGLRKDQTGITLYMDQISIDDEFMHLEISNFPFYVPSLEILETLKPANINEYIEDIYKIYKEYMKRD